MMKDVYFYFHAGSKNHGCEAIVRSTQELLGIKPVLVSDHPEEDHQYNLDEIVDVKPRNAAGYGLTEKVKSAFSAKILKNEKMGYDILAKHETRIFPNGTVAMSIGGDNYCYGDAYNWHLAALNRYLQQKGIKTVLWGCSIEPETVTEEMKRDFARYDLIVARETDSYEFLRQCNKHTVLACDPAFLLQSEDCRLPDGFEIGNTVGLNLSPLIQKKETIEGITLDNYRKLIERIISETKYKIAFIPHVVCDGNDDREPLKELFGQYRDTGRLVLIEDQNCMRLKNVISKCSIFIGARTHATIAAYSTCVPTLVVGYSTKARGIANDIFGTADHYVLPVQGLKTENDLTNAFLWIEERKATIRDHLNEIMPAYQKSVQDGIQAVKELM